MERPEITKGKFWDKRGRQKATLVGHQAGEDTRGQISLTAVVGAGMLAFVRSHYSSGKMMTRLIASVTLALVACHTVHAKTAPSSQMAPSSPERIDGVFKLTDVKILRMVTGDDVAKLYPRQAADRDLNGASVVNCQVQEDGFLANCSVVTENPAGVGFGAATIKLAHLIRLEPDRYGPHATTDFPMRWIIK